MSKRFWTDGEEKILTEMAQRGATVDEVMAVLITRTKTSIFNKAQMLGLSLSGPDPEIDQEAFKRFMSGRNRAK